MHRVGCSGLTGTDEQIGVAVCAGGLRPSNHRAVKVFGGSGPCCASQAWLDWHSGWKIAQTVLVQRATSARRNCHVPPFLALLAGLFGRYFANVEKRQFW